MLLLIACTLASLTPLAAHQAVDAPPEPQQVLGFVNGLWFDGTDFVPGARYAVDGVLQERRPERVDLELDLDGGWVVPPYGDAHTHLLEPDIIEHYIAHLLHRGVFYVRDQGMTLSGRRQIEPQLNSARSFDFISANQGFTGPGGHPIQILRQLQLVGILPAEWNEAEFHGEGIFIVDSEEAIEAAWPQFLEGRPDFLKVFLLYSEAHLERSGNPAFTYRCGIDPALVPPLVERAHAAGLPVSAHVYTAHDFRVAVAAGVDQIAHFPGIGFEPELGEEAYLLSDADARLAGERGVTVATTLSELAGYPGEIESEIVEYVERVIAPNLKKLASSGVAVLLGSDRVRMTSDVEALAVFRLGLFDELSLLRMWCVETPQSVFPRRRIGGLADGFEASFLVLEGNPLEDFENTQRIALRVKQGRLLFPRERPFPPLGG